MICALGRAAEVPGFQPGEAGSTPAGHSFIESVAQRQSRCLLSRRLEVRFLPPELATKRKGKPIGDGSRLESGRAMSLEGSTPSPSASIHVSLAERQRLQASNLARRVRLPQDTLPDAG